MNDHALSIVAGIHLVGVVSWLGLIINSALVYLPVEQKLDREGLLATFPGFQKRTLWISLSAVIVLIAAGTILTVTNENDAGPSHMFSNPWSTLIFIKHILVAGMLIFQGWSVFVIHPRLIKILRNLHAAGLNLPDEAEKNVRLLLRRTRVFYVFSAILGVGVLVIIGVVLTLY